MKYCPYKEKIDNTVNEMIANGADRDAVLHALQTCALEFMQEVKDSRRIGQDA